MRVVPRARAFVIAIVLALHCVAGCPIEPVDRQLLSRPSNQRQLRALAGQATRLGLPRTTEEVEDLVLTASGGWRVFSDFVLTPVRPFHELTVTHQRWGLFTTAAPERYLMNIDVHRPHSPWAPAYRPQDPQATELADVLEYRRVRGVWNPGAHGIRAPYAGFVTFIARRLFRKHDDIDLVRVRMQKLTFLHPWEHESLGEPEFMNEEIRRRRDVEHPQ